MGLRLSTYWSARNGKWEMAKLSIVNYQLSIKAQPEWSPVS